MSDHALAETRAWVERAVIGLQLCPFAKAPQVKGQVRYVASDAVDADALVGALVDELKLLAATPADRIETTLLVHPRVFAEFEDQNDFLEIAEAALVALDLEGVIQIASFHPQYRFAGSDPDDIANATNRSPHPALHLLREDSIERALASFADPDSIFEANIATMERLGHEGWAALRRQCRDAAEREA
jgi:hypothetical protein